MTIIGTIDQKVVVVGSTRSIAGTLGVEVMIAVSPEVVMTHVDAVIVVAHMTDENAALRGAVIFVVTVTVHVTAVTADGIAVTVPADTGTTVRVGVTDTEAVIGKSAGLTGAMKFSVSGVDTMGTSAVIVRHQSKQCRRIEKDLTSHMSGAQDSNISNAVAVLVYSVRISTSSDKVHYYVILQCTTRLCATRLSTRSLT